MKISLLITILTYTLILSNRTLYSQPLVEVYATGFNYPIGLEIDGSGTLWVGEQGTGNGPTSKVSIVTPFGQVYTFLNDLPSTAPVSEPVGAQDVCFDVDGRLLVAIANDAGVDTLCGRVLFVDTTGFIPGGTPFNRTNIVASFDIGTIFPGDNPYKVIVGPDDDLFIVDASANAIARWQRTNGNLSLFSTFDPIGQIEAVPTGIVFTGSNFYVGILTGAPFPIGGANIYNVDLSGNKTVHQDGLTAIVDVAISPIDGALYAIQHAEFGPPWLNNKGKLFRIQNGNVDTLISELPKPSGMVFNSKGDLFISSYSDGEIFKITNLPVSVENKNNSLLTNYSLKQNYPNPFNPSTTIEFSIPMQSFVKLEVFNSLGEKISTLVAEELNTGSYKYNWNAAEYPSGAYFYKLTASEFSQTKKLLLIK